MLKNPGSDLGQVHKCSGVKCIVCIQYPVSLSFSIYIGFERIWWRLFQESVVSFYYMSQHPKKLHTTFQAAWQYRGWGKQIKPVTYAWWRRTVVLILIIWFENCTKYAINHVSTAALTTGCLQPTPTFWNIIFNKHYITSVYITINDSYR